MGCMRISAYLHSSIEHHCTHTCFQYLSRPSEILSVHCLYKRMMRTQAIKYDVRPDARGHSMGCMRISAYLHSSIEHHCTHTCYQYLSRPSEILSVHHLYKRMMRVQAFKYDVRPDARGSFRGRVNGNTVHA